MILYTVSLIITTKTFLLQTILFNEYIFLAVARQRNVTTTYTYSTTYVQKYIDMNVLKSTKTLYSSKILAMLYVCRSYSAFNSPVLLPSTA